MRGSIAIWHTTTSDNNAAGYAPRVQVHINIWRNTERKKDRYYDLFDIGLLFEELRSLETLSISLPFVIKDPEDVSDLFEVMDDPPTLSAIFNETLTPGTMQDGDRTFAATHTETEKVQFYVASCPSKQRLLSTIGSGEDQGSLITLTDKFFKRLKKRVGDHYCRLRIKLPIDQKNGFVSTSDNPEDSAFLSTISSNEIVEFRLNERRNFSPAIRGRLDAKNCGLIDISAVHYFLIRDMGVEMTQSHTGFKKMRRLEPGMWKRYLQDYNGFSPDQMIIYHWAVFAQSETKSVESFTALATFRAYYTGSLFFYGAIIVLLGAMGSALQGFAVAILPALGPTDFGCSASGAACATAGWNMVAFTLALLGVIAMVRWRRKA